MDKEKIIQAGKIASQIKKEIKPEIKLGMPLVEIAEKIESRIKELGGKPAFPVNLSINEVAAHFTPSHDSEEKAEGLLKVDFGVHVDGWTADNAFSLDLEGSEENKKLIEAAEAALEKAQEKIQTEIKTSEIGKTIQEEVESKNLSPIMNLSGHSIDQYDLHSGITIPNINDKTNIELKEGLYAIEPFTTSGNGKVHNGKPSGIYQLIEKKNTRSPTAREVLNYIAEEYNTLPFCTRWLVKKFSTKAIIALKQLEEQGIVHHYPQLIETSKAKVAQAENTVLLTDKEKIITTL